MTNDLLIQSINSQITDSQTRMGFEYVETIIPHEKLHEIMLHFRNSPEFAFDYMFCLTGVDFENYLQVIYHLESTKNKHILIVKVNTENRENPVLDSVSDIWPTADPNENEVFDLLGITFRNHPEPRRLFLDDTWGYPLRKDYKDDIHIVSR